jgi:hypothetical protein
LINLYVLLLSKFPFVRREDTLASFEYRRYGNPTTEALEKKTR